MVSPRRIKRCLFLIGWFLGGIVISASGQDMPKKSPGEWSGQWRTFYLSTHNKNDLKDFYALATGGHLKYVYTFKEHLKLGGAFYTSINTGIQDLTVPDMTTGRLSRYEAGLFNFQDLDDNFIGFLGELFVQYRKNSHEVTIGRMKISSPFINPEDGRMIPTLEQGLWYRYQPENIKVQVGFFNEIAARSGRGFFNIGESIGIYPVGRNPDGSPSRYEGNTRSDFVAVANVDMKPLEKVSFEIWDYYIENVFHSVYFRPTLALNDQTSIMAEWLHQDRVGDGGNNVDSLRYFSDQSSNIVGLQISQKAGNARLSLGYDYILKGGRFLFPREWGREFLFSFQKRERSEGAANNHALAFFYDRTFKIRDTKLRNIFSVGHHWKADVTNAEDNKYAQPGYTHINLDLFWMSEKAKNLKPELLLTYKKGQRNIPENPNFYLNKVDMFQINFVINYNF